MKLPPQLLAISFLLLFPVLILPQPAEADVLTITYNVSRFQTDVVGPGFTTVIFSGSITNTSKAPITFQLTGGPSPFEPYVASFQNGIGFPGITLGAGASTGTLNLAIVTMQPFDPSLTYPGFVNIVLAAVNPNTGQSFTENDATIGVFTSLPGGGLSPNVSIFVPGSLENPRGLKFGPDGNLYVAEGGLPNGTFSTVGQCAQVPAPLGPRVGGNTARISMINASGNRTTVLDGLPATQTSMQTRSEVSGIADVAFVGNTLYALVAGGGCSHAHPEFPASVIRVDREKGTYQIVADLSAYQAANPVAQPDRKDFEPDGSWYSMVARDGTLFSIEANHGEFVKIDPDGDTDSPSSPDSDSDVKRLVDFSALHFNLVPTSLAARRGSFFVGNLGPFPIRPGTQDIYKVSHATDSESARVKILVHGVTSVLGVTFDEDGRLYILETSDVPNTMNGGPASGHGVVVRVSDSGSLETIATGLTFPTAMTFGPDGKLYVSNNGFGVFGNGGGQILRITIPEPDDE
jgi:hypothetical protein